MSTAPQALRHAVDRLARSLTAAWYGLSGERRERLLRRRRRVVWLVGVVAGSLSPVLLIPAALVAYILHPQPRRASAAVLAVLCMAVPVMWIGHLVADLSFADSDDTTLVISVGLAALLVAGVARLEYRAKGASEVRPLLPWLRRGIDPARYGIPPFRILLGYKGRAWVTAPRQVGALVIGPPRSGKTSSVIIPNVVAWTGPVVVTSTRRDVLDACRALRAQRGTVWCFDPIGTVAASMPSTVHRLDWSPVQGAGSFDSALARARALLAGSVEGTEGRDHWRARGTQLLGALFHAAAQASLPMSAVVEWVHGGRLDAAARIVDGSTETASSAVLAGIAQTPDRERGSVWSAVAGALVSFDDTTVLASADRASACGFSADDFLDGAGSVFVVAPSDDSTPLAPLVVGLVEEIRRCALRRSNAIGALSLPLLLALDEIATICPVPSLPQIAAEGGGRNIVLLAVLQDLAQATARWGREVADSLMTLAGAKLILPGVGDVDTLQRLETLAGKHWVEQVSRSHTHGGLFSNAAAWTTHRSDTELPRMPAGAIRQLPPGRALLIEDRRPEGVVRLIQPGRRVLVP
jgi:type IV secretory pathway TraG/TraD family ATPase VirD4